MYIVEKEPKSVAAESYRTLRTNIEYSIIDEKNKVILVTSSEPGEGKTTTSGNIALALAQSDKKVIIVDCDLRKPSIHKRFKLSNEVGLSEVILGKESITFAGQKYSDNLTVLTSGKIPPNPSEMLASKNMTSLVEALKKVFDYVILDTPPVLAVTDAQIIATKADGVVLVVRAEKTKKDTVKSALELLKKVNANILGTVLNGTEMKKDNYYYYYG